MKFATVLASLLLAVTSAFAQTPPKTQLALVVDQTGGGGFGAVHRIDTRTGKYLGYFGQGTLFNPVAIAVQPSTNVVFVDDDQALKKLDMSTGRFIGLVARNTDLGGPVASMRFAPNGSLFAAIKISATQYNLVRIDPSTGAVVKSVTKPTTTYETKVSVGFRPDGRVSVFNSFGTMNYEEYYNYSTLGYLDFVSIPGPVDPAEFRTSSDVFLRRLSNGSVASGVGNFAVGTSIGTAAVTGPLFAEGALNQTFLFGDLSGKTILIAYDTSGLGFLTGATYTSVFAHGTLVDMAIYAK